MPTLNEWDGNRGRSGRPWRRLHAWCKANMGDVCSLCGEWIDKALPAPHRRSFTVDHITPLSMGGHPTDLSNLAPAHYGCNAAKGAGINATGERADHLSTDW
jgi:5-methylcytosine-specific restriction endonuclease McrA